MLLVSCEGQRGWMERGVGNEEEEEEEEAEEEEEVVS